MSFPKGRARPDGAGRKKGTPNHFTQSLYEKCAEAGVDPFMVFIDMIRDPSIDPHLKLKAATEAAKYLYPTRKAVEVSTAAPQLIDVTNQLNDKSDEELKQLIAAELDKKSET